MIYYNETKSQPIFIIGTGKNYSYVCSQRFIGKLCPPQEEEPTPGRGRLYEGRLSRKVPLFRRNLGVQFLVVTRLAAIIKTRPQLQTGMLKTDKSKKTHNII